jgi:threonine dehydrogenase-like Zn-dependent dehydrogenase
MPLRLYAPAPGRLDFREVALGPLPPDAVRIRTYMTGIRHGEDLRRLRGKGLDDLFPWTPPSWGVGEVIAVGAQVSRYTVGDWVHGPMPHQEEWIFPESRAHPLHWLRREFAPFVEPGIVALSGVRSAHPAYGDRSAVFGLGTVGLMALQFLWHSGMRQIIAVDPFPARIRVAQRLGAHHIMAINHTYDSLSPEDRSILSQLDCALDFSGEPAALHAAVQSLKPQGTLVLGGWNDADTDAASWRPAADAKRLRILAVPDPVGDSLLEEIVIESICAKKVIVWPIHSHTFSFRDAPQAYRKIERHPQDYLKVLLQYFEI